jgi:hypothetical protein
MKETQLCYEWKLVRSWCPPLERKGSQRPVKLIHTLSAHLCPSRIKETECHKELFRSWCSPLLLKDRRNGMKYYSFLAPFLPKSTKEIQPLGRTDKPFVPTSAPQAQKIHNPVPDLLLMPASGAQRPLTVLTKLSFLVPTSAPQAPKNRFLSQTVSLLVPVSAA